MAVPMSVELNTMRGAFPPSSSDTLFTVPAHLDMSCLPTAVEPVKESLRTRSLSQSLFPTKGVFVRLDGSTLKTPGGNSACRVNYNGKIITNKFMCFYYFKISRTSHIPNLHNPNMLVYMHCEKYATLKPVYSHLLKPEQSRESRLMA